MVKPADFRRSRQLQYDIFEIRRERDPVEVPADRLKGAAQDSELSDTGSWTSPVHVGHMSARPRIATTEFVVWIARICQDLPFQSPHGRFVDPSTWIVPERMRGCRSFHVHRHRPTPTCSTDMRTRLGMSHGSPSATKLHPHEANTVRLPSQKSFHICVRCGSGYSLAADTNNAWSSHGR